jgi:microsomal dipeptidase-like Zn-dependent dipeptidase
VRRSIAKLSAVLTLVLVPVLASATRSATTAPRPEAEVGASGRSFSGTAKDGTVLGFVDDHMHITANLRAGGRVLHGEPYDTRGIAYALGGDARDHGKDGSLDITGNLLRNGTPFGTHGTDGWPTFSGWPVHDTNTHQQAYWVWLERAWKAGMRLVVAQTIEDDELCRIEPKRSHSCSEPATIAKQVRILRGLQAYVDAQSGGPGRGWFRLVYDSKQARRVIEQGKLAVLIGVESSNPFGCRLKAGRSVCTKADVDRGLASYHRLGIRSLFIAHWFDNAFAGAALEDGTKGEFIGALNRLETGHYFSVGRCPLPGQGEHAIVAPPAILKIVVTYFPGVRPLLTAPVPTYPKARSCNTRGLTKLGEYLVRRMMAKHMMIEADHLSEKARDRVLTIAAAEHYPLISSHTGTGGTWTPAELRRLYALGGLAAATPGTAPELIAKIDRFGRYRAGRKHFGVGIGTDVGGFSSLPGPRKDAASHPLRYPFTSYLCHVTFKREKTGIRVFDLNKDGVAHYGLIADLIADMQHRKNGKKALGLLFHSAEAYLEMWGRAEAHA